MVQHNQLHGKLDYAILIFNIFALTGILFLLGKAVRILWDRAGIKVVDESVDVTSRRMSDRKYFFVVWGIQLLCWLPVFLAFYPGIFSYDVRWQIPQTWGSYGLHHPLAHTLYIQFFYYVLGGWVFHNYNTGIAISTLVQMIIFSMSLSYMHLFLRRLFICRKIRLWVVAFFSLFPLIPMMAISSTKDIIFAANVLLLMTVLGYWARLPQYCYNKWYMAVFIVSVVGTVLFRNNGIYAVAALLVAVFALNVKKRSNYRLIAYILIGFVLGVALLTGLRVGLQARPGPVNEMLSVPYQQMARIYKYKQGTLTQTEKQEIKLILPEVEKYNPAVSDQVKSKGTAEKHKRDFVITYIELLTKYPGSSVTAISLLNGGYLSITDMSISSIYGAGICCFTHVDEYGLGTKRDSFILALEKLYIKLFNTKELRYGNVLGLNIFCSLAAYFWILIFMMIKVVREKKRELLPMVAFLGMFLLTLLAGPCALIRYALPYILAVPVLWGCVVTHRHEEPNNNI